jgi:hypothetical protein
MHPFIAAALLSMPRSRPRGGEEEARRRHVPLVLTLVGRYLLRLVPG